MGQLRKTKSRRPRYGAQQPTMNKFFLLAFAVCQSVITVAQTQEHKRCMLDEATNELLQKQPVLRAKYEAQLAQKHTLAAQKQSASSSAKTTGTEVTIPVVFHIVLTASQQNVIGGATGIARRVDSQIAVLNRDFNRRSLDSISIPAVFKPLFGNAQIKFKLARRKPDGSATPGYEIVTTNKQNFSALSGTVGSTFLCSDVKYNSSGGADSWDLPDPGPQYLNIWVLNFTETSILGIAAPTAYVSFGAISDNEVGACINYRAFGKRASVQDNYISGADGGRTAVHEIGHVFGLNHIWGNSSVGSGTCSDDDGISDTPQQKDANSSNCPNFPKPNCINSNGGEMFMNFMDYVVDACYKMFTLEQCGVMNDDLNGGFGTGMTTHPELTEWPATIPTISSTTDFQVYPNPASDKLSLRFNATVPPGQLCLTDIAGRRLKTITVDNRSNPTLTLDVSNVPRGIYFLQGVFDEVTVTKKIVLE